MNLLHLAGAIGQVVVGVWNFPYTMKNEACWLRILLTGFSQLKRQWWCLLTCVPPLLRIIESMMTNKKIVTVIINNRRAVLNYPVPAIRWASEEDFTGMTHYPATETEQRVVTLVPADGFTRITSHDRRILCEPGRSSPASCLQHAGTSFANGALS